MRIHVLDAPVGTLVAREETFDAPEGEFHISPVGRVDYRHHSDDRAWLAGETFDQFVSAAAAWNEYTVEVTGLAELDQIHAVENLRQRLWSIQAIQDPSSLWQCCSSRPRPDSYEPPSTALRLNGRCLRLHCPVATLLISSRRNSAHEPEIVSRTNARLEGDRAPGVNALSDRPPSPLQPARSPPPGVPDKSARGSGRRARGRR